ncbi:hypothetical protein LCGC14_1943940 [marine sediment metagenome]|uniref:Uncharacterized protein n=1 Tax=marine sediment metagenome TaxID=412755 RepID=A0A0F9FJS2_9ZZZZ
MNEIDLNKLPRACLEARIAELEGQVEELVEAGRAVDEFFVFFDSIIPPDNTGPRITLRKLSAVLAKHAGKEGG